FTTIDVPSTFGTRTRAFAINDAGQIAGTFTSGNSHGFLLSGGVFTRIDDPSADGGTDVSGINASGQIAGTYFFAGISHGFLRDASGHFTTLDVPLANNTFAEGINDAGQIVGRYDDATGIHGFLYSGGTSAPPTA